MTRTKILCFISLLLIILSIYGCASYVSISDIKSDPSKYQDKQVIVKGKVAESLGLPFMQKGMYQLDDGTDTIWVLSKNVPFRGEKVTVKGTIKSAITVNDRTFGTIIVE